MKVTKRQLRDLLKEAIALPYGPYNAIKTLEDAQKVESLVLLNRLLANQRYEVLHDITINDPSTPSIVKELGAKIRNYQMPLASAGSYKIN